jgi:Cdc6-like AAA superfamily ATPase
LRESGSEWIVTSVFISYSQSDSDVALRIASRIKEKGFTALLLDSPLECAVDEWERGLIRCLQSSRLVVTLISNTYVRSCRCFAELNLARFLGKPIIALRVSPSIKHPLLSDTQYINLSDDEQQGFKTMWTELKKFTGEMFIGSGIGLRPPYPGLMEFREEDAPIFFGRENEIQRTFEFLRIARHSWTERFIIVVGPSGCGKTSLLRAGVIPLLQTTDPAWQVMQPIVIDEQPLWVLGTILIKALKTHQTGLSDKIAKFVNHLRGQEGPNKLNQVARVVLEQARVPNGVLLLVLDRLEGLFLDVEEDDAKIFAELLKGTLETTDSQIIVAAALRADYLSDFQNNSILSSIRNQILHLGPISEINLNDVIRGPARKAGLEIEDDLVVRLVQDTHGANSLPLLAFTLRELWEQSHDRERLALDDYLKYGEIGAVLDRNAERAYASVSLSNSEGDAFRDTFLTLVTIDSDGEVRRRKAFMEEIPVNGHKLLQTFIEARLLVASHEQGHSVVEIAHEALLRTWVRLRHLIDEVRIDLRLRSALAEAAREWADNDRNPIYLWPKGRGQMVADAMTRLPDSLNEVERAFLEKVCEEVTATGSVFISYAKEDRKSAEQFARAIEQEGWQVWWDLRIQPGEDFDKAIETALNESNCVLVLWSERATSSLYVKGEAREALAQEKLIPIFIENVKPPFDLRAIQGVYLLDWTGRRDDPSYQQVIDRLEYFIPKLA